MTAKAAIVLLALYGTAAGAALPEDYITSIPVPDVAAIHANEEAEPDSEADLPSIFDFLCIRIIDANGDSYPDLLLFGNNIRIVLARLDLSTVTLPCGNKQTLGDSSGIAGKAMGRLLPGSVNRILMHACICSAFRSMSQVDIQI